MSQVIITEDKLTARRQKSAESERKIDIEGAMSRWRMSNVTGFDPVAAAVGIAVMPIAFIWFLIGSLVKLAIYISISVSRFVGALIGRSKKL
jgi:hypothetical protein